MDYNIRLKYYKIYNNIIHYNKEIKEEIYNIYINYRVQLKIHKS